MKATRRVPGQRNRLPNCDIRPNLHLLRLFPLQNLKHSSVPSHLLFPHLFSLLLPSEYCVEARQGEYLFYAANGGVALIVLGLIHFLMCLAANYAHIKGKVTVGLMCTMTQEKIVNYTT